MGKLTLDPSGIQRQSMADPTLLELETAMLKKELVTGRFIEMQNDSRGLEYTRCMIRYKTKNIVVPVSQMGIDFEMTIISAHREPDIFFEWAKGAKDRGVKVIIAGAGKAAHLPGMCAALFPMPVIGIPMKTSDLGGVDSLYSIVQMPSGIPVATVAINGGLNAGILAAKILATSDEKLLEKLEAYSEEMKQSVVEKAEKLDKVGYKDYE